MYLTEYDCITSSKNTKTNEIVKQLTLRTGRLLQASLFWHCR